MMANTMGAAYCDLKHERDVLTSKIERSRSEPTMPYKRCWSAKPARRCIMILGSNKCQYYVRAGKRCSGSNVADACTCDTDPLGDSC